MYTRSQHGVLMGTEMKNKESGRDGPDDAGLVMLCGPKRSSGFVRRHIYRPSRTVRTHMVEDFPASSAEVRCGPRRSKLDGVIVHELSEVCRGGQPWRMSETNLSYRRTGQQSWAPEQQTAEMGSLATARSFAIVFFSQSHWVLGPTPTRATSNSP